MNTNKKFYLEHNYIFLDSTFHSVLLHINHYLKIKHELYILQLLFFNLFKFI